MLHKCQNIKDNGVMVYFNGPVCQTMVESIGKVMRHKMTSQNHKMTLVQRVFAVLVEQMQNIVNYCDSGETTLPEGQIVVYRADGGIHVSSGNAMAPNEADRLRNSIDALNNMNQQELKMYYKEQRRRPAPDHSKGAGLGLNALRCTELLSK